MTPVIGDLIQSTVGSVINRLADKYLPASMDEKQKAEFSLEAGRLAIEEYKTAVADVQGARTLASLESESASSWTRVLTVTHRPVWSFLMLFIFIWTILAPYFKFPVITMTDVHKEIMQTVIVFYFGGRSVEKAVDTVWGRRFF